MKNFRKKVRELYKPYYKNGDEAHLISHADDVCDLALKLNENCDERLVILASYMHDMFNAQERKNHNRLAYDYVLKRGDNFLMELSEDEILLVAHAVLEHRGNFKGEFFSTLSEIISSADRGLPDLEFIVLRSMKFNNADAQDVYEYITSRYGVDGYANYPDVYKKFFKKELMEFQKLADELTVKRILEIWNNKKYG